MTEKVVSLSGGLVLGMVFALVLGIGATQNMSPSARFEIPSLMQMTIAQTSRSTSTPAADTTPAVSVSTPSNEEDRGRITRIATLTATPDPAAESVQPEPKNRAYSPDREVLTDLQRANLQHSYIAVNSTTTTSSAIDMAAARQSNFTSIANNTYGRNGYGNSQNPSFLNNKPQSQGSPSAAQNNPQDDPEVSGSSAKPGSNPDPDFLPDGNTNHGVDLTNPAHPRAHVPNGGGSMESDRRRRPEFD